MSLSTKSAQAFALGWRVLLALVGGFAIANLAAIAISQLPGDNKVDSIVAGMMWGFVVYTLVVLSVFAVRTALRATLLVSTLTALLYGLIHLLSVSEAV
ncbi:hypothetical protein CWB99_01735 [Pseudoalteromonas rubra]|uniref:Iron transporter n=1 Tax=Pseudoalteromonas rubra TaxID=43658 RepID=A0A5S3WUL1_9GAMM|nr:hypothetical protein [Pseudoalteromonas rubra]TMP32617.1 hypothetical protein CWB99_01735 [Pseudoalteromonas rubra]TMP34319.1 hypothetical protein CWC00_08065 [Pseudoalteromonas rubra]